MSSDMTASVEKFFHTMATLVLVAQVFFVIGLYMSVTFGSYWSEDSSSTPAPPPATRTQAVAERALPDILRIRAIGINAKVQSVGLDANTNNQMGVPSNFTDVGWYNLGPRPGMMGSAVIDGHYNGKGVPKAVFYDLNKLTPGDVVEIIDVEGAVIQFKVVRVGTYAYDAPTEEVFSQETKKPRLNLITCAGDWLKGEALYDTRTVVFTELID